MYASPRVLISLPADPSTAQRPSTAILITRSMGLLFSLVVYLIGCHAAAGMTRLGRRLAAALRSYLREQRRTRRFLLTAGAFGIAIALGISAGGSSLALWNATTPIGAVKLSTGSTGITINGITNYTVPGLTTTQLLPGLSAVSPQVLTILNTGTTPLTVSVGAPVFADPSSLLAQNNNLAVSLFQSTNCAQSVDGSTTAAWTTPVVLAVGASVTACLQMTLSATAPSTVQGLSATFTIPVNGTQVRNNP
jgi:hypothetical protein